MKINTGGPAFACPGGEYNYAQKGMTLRDWFAVQWMAAGHHATLTPQEAAEHAYEYADAMIGARDAMK